MSKECKTCNLLTSCELTNENALLNHFVCPDWRVASDAELRAREEVEQELGLWALRYTLPNVKKRAKPKARRFKHG